MSPVPQERDAAEALLALVLAGKLAAAGARQLAAGLVGTAAGADEVFAAAGVARAAVNGSLARARGILDDGERFGVVAVPMHSPRYPQRLRRLQDAPFVIYVRGRLEALHAANAVSVVGTRRASVKGAAIATRVARALSDAGWSVVSGLAGGVDVAALAGGVRGPCPAVVVLAGGLDLRLPAARVEPAQAVLAHGGAWVSEQPPGVAADAASLAASRRIEVGLSVGSVVVEGAEQSGARAHVDIALREGRALAAVVPRGGGTACALPRWLVRSHAALALASRDDYPALLARLESAQASELA